MPTTEQIRTEAIQTIRKIFENVLADLRNHSNPSNEIYFNHEIFKIECYRDALIHEVNTQKTTCDHPVRAAFALDKLHTSKPEDFHDNLKNFKYHSQHSGLYPTTRKIGKVLSASFLPAGIVTLGIIVHPVYLALLFFVVGCYKDDLIAAKNAYSDVFEAKEKGKDVYKFYSLFQKPSSQPQPPPYEAKPPEPFASPQALGNN